MRRTVLLFVLFGQTLALAWMSWSYDPEARLAAYRWEAAAQMLGAALESCQPAHTTEADFAPYVAPWVGPPNLG